MTIINKVPASTYQPPILNRKTLVNDDRFSDNGYLVIN
jgi:hypothetical protein